jgi:hypothetical protein
LFKGNEREILLKEIGGIIDAEKLVQISQVEVEELPVFGGSNPENLQKNETFTKKDEFEQQITLLIDSPSSDYLVNAPINPSASKRLIDTPKFD